MTRRQLTTLIVLCCTGILASLFSYISIRNFEQRHLDADFARMSNDRIHAFQARLTSNVNKIRSVAAFFNASEKVERSEFREFVRSVLINNTDIQALQWIPQVTDSQRSQFESSTQLDGHPHFQITEKRQQGVIVQAIKREEYFPVYYLEPLKGNEELLGFDLAANPILYEALKLSRDSGEIRASARITLSHSTIEQNGFFIFMPVYKKASPLGPAVARHQELEGFVVGVFRIRDMLEDALSGLTPEGIHIYVYDKNSTAPEEDFLYYHASRTTVDTSMPYVKRGDLIEKYHFSRPVTVADRKWQVICLPTLDFVASHTTWQRLGIPFLILLFALLIANSFFMTFKETEQKNLQPKRKSEVPDLLT